VCVPEGIMDLYTSINLKKEPFTTSPDPEFFYRSETHNIALQRLEIAIRLKRGLSVVFGDVGTGKTTLSRALFQCFDGEDDYIFHMILDPSFKSEHQFLVQLTKLFGISPFFRSSIDHREAIEKYLYQKCVEEKKTITLLIDEGQKLSLNQLEVLRTLLNYETNEFKMLQLVIMAQTELLPKINSIQNFMDRISFKYKILPFTEEETGHMINFRLKQAGYRADTDLFTNEAIKIIYEQTKGYPRKIALIGHQVMEYLIVENYEKVTSELLERVIAREEAWC